MSIVRSVMPILLILAFVCVAAGQEPEYVCIKVHGSIKLQAKNTFLKTGERIGAGEKVSFASKDAYAVLMHPRQGRRILRASGKTSSEFLDIAANLFVPGPKPMQMAAEGAAPGGKREPPAKRKLTPLERFSESFPPRAMVVLGDGGIPIPKDVFSGKPGGCFTVELYAGGSEDTAAPVMKSVMKNGMLMLGCEHLLGKDCDRERKTNPCINLVWHEQKNDEGEVVRSTELIYPPKTALEKEIATMIDELRSQKKDDTAIAGDLAAYIIDEYGPLHPALYARWLEAHGLKPKQ